MAVQVTGRAEAHNQAVLHPDQDRVMSIRENARMQVNPSLDRAFVRKHTSHCFGFSKFSMGFAAALVRSSNHLRPGIAMLAFGCGVAAEALQMLCSRECTMYH